LLFFLISRRNRDVVKTVKTFLYREIDFTSVTLNADILPLKHE